MIPSAPPVSDAGPHSSVSPVCRSDPSFTVKNIYVLNPDGKFVTYGAELLAQLLVPL